MTRIIVVKKSEVQSAVAEALASSDIATGAEVEAHTALTTDAHGGIVAATHLTASDPHTTYLNNSRGDSRYYVKATADGRYVLISSVGVAGGVVPVNALGVIDERFIPAVAITDVFEVATEAAMLALVAQRGDMAVRSDLNKSFVLRATPASTLTNWAELRTPTDAVLSVDGLTGAVSLATRYAALNHKARHAKGGPDALLPSDIEALSRVWDEGTQLAYGQDLDFRGDGVIVTRDATTGRIFVTISGAAAGLASETAPGIAEQATEAELRAGASGNLFATVARLKVELDRRSAITKVERQVNQTVSNSTWTLVNWDTEAVDMGGWWTPASPTRMTVAEAGNYELLVLSAWAASNTGGRFCRILKNGSVSATQAQMTMSGMVDSKGRFDTFGIGVLAAGDFLSVEVFQNSGGSLTFGDTSDVAVPVPYFVVRRV